MKKLLVGSIGAALVITSWGAPASAHHPEPYSFIACAVGRPNPDHVVDHAHPYFLNSSVLLTHCDTHDIDSRCKYDMAIWKGGLITGPYPNPAPCIEVPA